MFQEVSKLLLVEVKLMDDSGSRRAVKGGPTHTPLPSPVEYMSMTSPHTTPDAVLAIPDETLEHTK